MIMRIVLLSTLLFIAVNANIFAQEISENHLKALVGTWEGSLTYTDDDDRTVRSGSSMKAVWKKNKLLVTFYHARNSGWVEKDKKSLALSLEKGQFNFDGDKWEVIEFINSELGWKMVLERRGLYKNKNSTFRQIIDYDNENLIVENMVRYEGADQYLKRNKYYLTR